MTEKILLKLQNVTPYKIPPPEIAEETSNETDRILKQRYKALSWRDSPENKFPAVELIIKEIESENGSSLCMEMKGKLNGITWYEPINNIFDWRDHQFYTINKVGPKSFVSVLDYYDVKRDRHVNIALGLVMNTLKDELNLNDVLVSFDKRVENRIMRQKVNLNDQYGDYGNSQ
ncbi:hypothetical protein KP2612_001028 [Komagataella phaffii]|uniref:Uncharacterized protein n=1 Tax=Komagataella phaffii (strain GS115 / ATCC 20864) TaxID=644223 RepID=C4QXR0_KOMPG|nr:Hypothetical protein PAS_chr1-4_0200 [Komagataella phaffii GS115]AOA61592.1 GQ67_01980T0 [Komagataella phaffii]AOA65666.1 GQ68_01995T0 [Komagataella phaffii GS115]CAH2446850.1 Conserved predicted protein [Komagataella phaffii CBS 7435]CAY68033.1 Hypothetical protein PAS_chr1-4_0200 [Komagataella phaffii GS115]